MAQSEEPPPEKQEEDDGEPDRIPRALEVAKTMLEIVWLVARLLTM